MFLKNLKKIAPIALLTGLVLSVTTTYAQVSINTTGAAPGASTILDMSAVLNKGILLPHIPLTSTADNTTIASAATGLFIYNSATVSDVTPGYYYWNGTTWTRFNTTALTFENGITKSGTTIKLGGSLTETTTINFGGGFGNNLIFNLKNNSDFIIQNTTSNVEMVKFARDGNTNFVGNISSGEYYNFDGTFGTSGYGFREKAGAVEYKKNGGAWAPFPDAPPVGGAAYWWYNPASTNYIRPQGNGNVRVFNSGERYGFYYNGSSNQFGGYFETGSVADTTSAVVGYSNVAGSTTLGYLGFNGTYNSGSGLVVDGAAVYGVVDDKKRAAVFGRTTRDANVAAIIGYSDVWISGYYYSKDVDATSSKHPALYGQLIVDVNKSGNQAAVKGYSEYTPGTDNRGFTVGGDFIAVGGTQDASGIEAYSSTAGVGTEAYGVYASTINAEKTYGLYAKSGTAGTTVTSYGVYGSALTATGSGVIGMGSALPENHLFTTGSGDGVVGGSDAGVGVFGYFYNGTGAHSYGTLGYSKVSANFFYHLEDNADGNNQSTLKATRTRGAVASPGAAYTYGNTNHAILGYNDKPDSYTFGVVGHCTSAGSGRTGAVFGNDNFASGALGYENSVFADVGVYGSTAYSTLARGPNTASSGVGVAGYGNFTGAWFRGEVYGTIIKGERFAQYIDGKTYTNGAIVRLESNGRHERIPTYVSTSMTDDIYIRGTGTLENGKATIEFDQKYQNIISQNEPVIVTVTPIGETEGLHLVHLKSSGFEVAENSAGTSNIKFTWIAVAVRKGAENIENPSEVLSHNFDQKLDGYLFNENNTNESAQPMWWTGTALSFDALPIKTGKERSTVQEENPPVKAKTGASKKAQKSNKDIFKPLSVNKK